MGYIDESLAPNETLIYRARFHWLKKAGAWLTLAVFIVAALSCLTYATDWPAWVAALAIAAVGVGLFISIMWPVWTTEIGVTNHRFILKTGWLERRTDELLLTSIEEVNLAQSALGRIFDYGRLVLHGTGVNDIVLPPLADPIGLRRALQEAVGAARVPVAMAVPQPPAVQSAAGA